MRSRSKLILAAVVATALLGMAVSSASANRLSLSNVNEGFRIVWSLLVLEAGGSSIECPVTLEGSFEVSSIIKRDRTRVGAITRAAVNGAACNNEGGATVLTATLPWDVQYSSFGGTLPNITTITLRLIRAAFRVRIIGVECLAVTEANQPAVGIGAVRNVSGNLKITELTAEERAGITTTGGFFCSLAGAAHFGGTGTVTGLTGGAGVLLQLI